MKQKSYHHSRKLRQFRYVAKQLTRLQAQGLDSTVVQRRWLQLKDKLQHLYARLQGIFPNAYLRKAAAGAALILGLSGAAQAQPFNPTPQINPFGLQGVGYLPLPTFADIDEDGDLDFFSTAIFPYTGYGLRYAENTGTADNPQFGPLITDPFNSNFENYITNPVLVDIDNDGDLDVFVGEFYYGSSVKFIENTGTAQVPDFSSPVQNSPFGLTVPGEYASFVDFADIDNDGDYDFFRTGYYGNLTFYENIGTPEAPEFSTTGVTTPFGITSTFFYTIIAPFDFADLDGDGDLDLFLNNYDVTQGENRMYYYENTGTPEAAQFGSPNTEPFGIFVDGFYVAQPSLADIDGDGDTDLLVGYYTDLYLFENLQNGNIAPTSEDFTVVMDQDESYTFLSTDFPYMDANGQLFDGILITSLPAVGSLQLNGVDVMMGQFIDATSLSQLVFTPVAGEFGDNYASFGFQVSDGGLFSDEHLVSFNVLEINAVPTSADFTVTVEENSSYTFQLADFPFDDSNMDDVLTTLTIVSTPALGLLTLDGTIIAANTVVPADEVNLLVYTPLPNEAGDNYTSFTFTVSDGQAQSSPANTVTIDVDPLGSTAGIDLDGQVAVSPNPAVNEVFVKASTLASGQLQGIRVYDVLGALVQEYQLDGYQSEVEQVLDVSQLGGVYYLEVTSDKGRFGTMITVE